MEQSSNTSESDSRQRVEPPPVPEGWHRHPKGGGLVQNTASVAASARLGIDAVVRDRARVRGDAYIDGTTIVAGNAAVYGNAHIFRNVRIYGNAHVYGNATIAGDVRIFGDGRVYGNAEVYGHSKIGGTAAVYGNADVSGGADVRGSAKVYGSAVIVDNGSAFGSAEVLGNAVISGRTFVLGGAWEESPPQMQIGRWNGFMSTPGSLQIGCERCEIAQGGHMYRWIEALAVEHEATRFEVLTARAFVRLCLEHLLRPGQPPKPSAD